MSFFCSRIITKIMIIFFIIAMSVTAGCGKQNQTGKIGEKDNKNNSDSTTNQIAGGNDIEITDLSKLKYPITNKFNFILGFGVSARNILNSFDGTFSKDMIPGVSTINFKFSPEEMKNIENKMNNINIMSYPDEFKPKDNGYSVTPYMTYYLRVEISGIVNEIKWKDENISTEKRAVELRQVIEEIQNMIYKREEYKAMPASNGGYL